MASCLLSLPKSISLLPILSPSGGGVVTDVAGFAASVYHRGVRVIHVATTLLAQIDAAIGGKTGVNLPEGKNLVGTFWQPSRVICDTSVLDNLPEREMVAAMPNAQKTEFGNYAVQVKVKARSKKSTFI